MRMCPRDWRGAATSSCAASPSRQARKRRRNLWSSGDAETVDCAASHAIAPHTPERR